MENLRKILEDHLLWINDRTKGVRADLRGAYLRFANLTGADLRDADLTSADLTSANLTGADLRGANLRRANLRDADFTGANLRDADLRFADFTGANLRFANFTGANLTGANLPVSLSFIYDNELIQKVAMNALFNDNSLKMCAWHTCETTHCIAGWATHLHPDGKRLVENSSEYLAGRLLLGDEAATHFFDSDDDAKEYLSQFLPK